MVKSCKLFKIHREIPVLVVSGQLAGEIGLKEGQQTELKCGSLSAAVTVVIKPDQEGMGLSQSVLNTLKLPEGLSLGIKTDRKGTCRVGPVVGILTFPHNIRKQDLNRYIPYAGRLRNSGFLYVFGPLDLNPLAKTIHGYHFDFSLNTWQPGDFPFPDTVIDRIYPNNFRAQAELEKVIGHNKLFNKNNLINKMNFFNSLNKDKLLKNFIPETSTLRTTADMEHFIRKHGEVFLKPLDGMKGHGIINVSADGGSLVCRYMSDGKPSSERISGPGQIFTLLERVNERKKAYIIQAAVKRMTYLGRPFSFRLMVVKDGLGQWKVPAIFAKAAEPGGFLTNNSSGASFVFLKDLFNCIENEYAVSQKECLSFMTYLSLKVAEALDRDYGLLGKIGIDVVLDTSGKPWLIEANGNPGIFPRSALEENPGWSSLMYDYPLAYCKYLAGF